jgi:hypothetical protein
MCWRVVQIIAQRDCKGGRIGTLAPTLSEASHPAPISAADAAAWAGAFEEYFAERKTNTDAIADLALENFEEVNSHGVLCNIAGTTGCMPILSINQIWQTNVSPSITVTYRLYPTFPGVAVYCE